MSESDGGIELLTLTRLWLFPRYVYRFLDHPLSMPINLRLVGWGVVVFAPLTLLLQALNVGWAVGRGLGLVPHLVLPGLVVWLVLTRVSAGGSPVEVAWSWARLAVSSVRRAEPQPHPVAVYGRGRA